MIRFRYYADEIKHFNSHKTYVSIFYAKTSSVIKNVNAISEI